MRKPKSAQLSQDAQVVRADIDAMLVEAVNEGARIVMDDADWAAIRKLARERVRHQTRGKKTGG